MEVDGLRYFVRTVELASISRAAQSLGLSQPAVSRQIRRLEDELGQPLLVRTGRGVRPTTSGHRLALEAALILADLDAIGEALRDEAAPSGTVSLALPVSVGDSLLPRILSIVDARFPELKLRVIEALSPVSADLVRSRSADYAIIYAGADVSGLASEPLVEEPLCFVSARDAPVADGADLAAVQRIKLILPGPSSGLRRILDAQTARLGLKLAVAVELDSVSAIKKLVAAGLGHSILPAFSVAPEVAAGLLVVQPILRPRLTRTLALAHLAVRPPSREMMAVRAATLEAIAQSV
ncbi:LysR family transcriptional regulator [Acuticoccus sp. I52.16.1]|uniref:LysR family transcriptional regulator n=1 Tax=Acuticoccus sp. I52.16.1 TaxID=2928472 RepID=UPI001FCF8E70|nr:LysR family transcriptional regulator [Acuticoccus sp. I52.16.1]UOM36586.1 LysR family transcriptional regulator [Acuticoccus sp. I52.16.1]